jgi:D-inositol-3-phosphate glycosyltransferase
VSRRLAERGVEVDVFTRATSSDLPPVVEMAPGVTVRHVSAGPFEGLGKEELPGQLCAFTAAVLREEAQHEEGHYDVVHSHYWLSGQVGWLARDRWSVPLIHTAHTLAKVKNEALADGDRPEPRSRVIGEEQVVAEADRLVANTDEEARQLVRHYDADPARTLVIPPGVDLDRFAPGDRAAARRAVGVPADALVLLFVGRIQPLKAPDVLLHAAARLLADDPLLRSHLRVHVVGAPSGSGLEAPEQLQKLAGDLGIADVVHFFPPQPPDRLAEHYRAADVAVVPSHNESFGLVALEAQACGTPVVAAAVGGLRTAVRDGVSGVLVAGHDPADYAAAVRAVLARRELLSVGARRHAARFSWDRTADALVAAYASAAEEMAGVVRRPVRDWAAAPLRVLPGMQVAR